MKRGYIHQSLKDTCGVSKRIGYEQDSCQYGEYKRQWYTEPYRGIHLFLIPVGGDTDEYSVYNSPHNKCPAGAVPEAGYEKGTKCRNIVVPVADAFPIDIPENVSSEETGEGHVPPLPIFLEILRFVRRIEVLGNVDVEHPAEANCHIGIAGQVKVVGNGIFDRVEPGLDHWQVACYMPKKLLCVCRQRIGDQHLFCTSDGKNEKSLCHIVINKFMVFPVFKLWYDLRVVDDRPDNELREKCDKQ